MGQSLSTTSHDHEFVEEDIQDKNFLPGKRDELTKSNNFAMDSSLQAITNAASGPTNADSSSVNTALEKLAQIELDELDKISLIYLLYDDPSMYQLALQYMMQVIEGSHIKILEDWAHYCSQKNLSWKFKLLEALCIIQHYQALTILGYTKAQMNAMYFPLNSNTAINIDICKKKLYRIFENFPYEQTATFLSAIREDMKYKNFEFKDFKCPYLEMYVLHWMTLKYVADDDLKNIIQVLKGMEMFEEAENLTPRASMKNIEPDPGLVQLVEHSKYQRSSSIASSSNFQQDKALESYTIDPKNPGICLIIDQEYFYAEFESKYNNLQSTLKEPLERRTGTEFDRKKLLETFKSFSFTVILKKNLTSFQMEKVIEETVLSVRDHSSLIICILSHGIEGMVYGSNSIPVSIKSIKDTMCSKNIQNLARKPKVLILQSCQGNQCQEVVPINDVEDELTEDGPSGNIPSTLDILTFYATVPGFGAVRDKRNGTWFIQTLCQQIIDNYSYRHFQDICTLVVGEVTEKRWKSDGKDKAMVSCLESTFTKFFYFPQMKEEF